MDVQGHPWISVYIHPLPLSNSASAKKTKLFDRVVWLVMSQHQFEKSTAVQIIHKTIY